MRVKFSLLLLALMAGGAIAQSKDVAIVGARIEIGDGKSIPAGTVLIHEGKIAAVGESLPIPAGADMIDAKGKVLYPGFIDAYTTRGLKLPEAPAAGTAPDSRNTAPASMWHGNRKGIRLDIVASKCLDLKDELKNNYSQGITTALLSPGTGTIRGIATVVDYTDTGNVLVPVAGGEIAIRGGGFGGGGGAAGGDTGYPGSLLGIIALTRQVLVDAQQYAEGTPDKKDDGFENLKPLMTKQVPALLAADSEREIARCGQLADEFGFKPIFCGGRDAYLLVDMIKAKNAAVFVSVDFGQEPTTKANSETADGTPQEVLDERHQTWVDRSECAKKLLQAGIPVAFSSSGGNLSDYLKNIRKIIATGVSKDAALKCMTSGPATILGIADRTGTIEVGKQANLVLMSGDFADEKSEVQVVFVEGKKNELKKGTE